MAGHASNWFKTGAGSAKGNVFISNTALMSAGLRKLDIHNILNGTYTGLPAMNANDLNELALQSVQPKGQASPITTEAQKVADRWAKKQAALIANPPDEEYDDEIIDLVDDTASVWSQANVDVKPTPEEKKAMGKYQTSGFAALNKLMWKSKITSKMGISLSGKSDSVVMAKHLMAVSVRQSAPFAFTAYRAVNASHPLHEWAKTVLAGDTYLNKGFDSSSLYPLIKPVDGSGKTTTRLIFDVPKGARGIFFSGMPGYENVMIEEMEWLAPANGSWLVKEVRDVNGVREVVVTLVGQRDLNGVSIWP